MTVQDQLEKVEELASEIAERRPATEQGGPGASGSAGQTPLGDRRAAGRKKRSLSIDEVWARRNLRWQAGRPIGDIANVLRILERHADFKGRFRYNEMVCRVLDKGTVMVDWRIAEFCAVIQERFIPGVDESAANKALVVAANRTGVSS